MFWGNMLKPRMLMSFSLAVAYIYIVGLSFSDIRNAIVDGNVIVDNACYKRVSTALLDHAVILVIGIGCIIAFVAKLPFRRDIVLVPFLLVLYLLLRLIAGQLICEWY